MRISEFPLAILRLQYQIARIPLRVIEDRVIARLNTETPARLFYERSLGMLDATVGSLLGDEKLAQDGATAVERSDALARAAEIDARANQKKNQADAKLNAVRDSAIEDIQAARDATDQQIQESRAASEERKQQAAEDAQQRVDALKHEAEEAAADRKRSVEAAKRQEEDQIRAEEANAANSARAKIDDAQQKHSEVGQKRAEADRFDELAEAEKEQRQATPAGD